MLNAKKIATYQRVSKEQQEHTRQNEIILQYLKNVENVATVDYKDKISATKKSFSKRQELGELLEAAQEKDIDAVVVSDLDRLSRQPKEHDVLRKLFQKLDIPVIIASKNQLYTSDDIIRNIIEAGLSKLETDNMSTRIRHALKEKMKNGKWRGGQVPYGFSLEETDGEKYFYAIESEMKFVKRIFEMYSTSGTFNSIAKKLNEVYGGYESNKKEKKKWTPNKVKYIVTNPIYMGVFAYHRFPDGGGYAFKERSEWKEVAKTEVVINAPITMEQWERCWQKYNKLKLSAPKYMNTSFYFKGILRCMCPVCEGKLFYTKDQLSNGRGSRWYISLCKKKVRADKLDEEFSKYWSWLQEKSDKLFQEEVRILLKNELHSLQAAKDSNAFMYNEKMELLKEIKQEAKRVTTDSEIGIEEFVKYENEVLIALIVTQQHLENQLSLLEQESKKLDFSIKKLEGVVNGPEGPTFDVNILPENFKKLGHEDKRSIVLMTVQECNYVFDEEENGKIEFVFHFPFKNYFEK
ncbi:recombinase family protein [Peribacillus butanolivorans]|uniref:recombinase family protein n=1 Tax=Peribacillus butanolivorans TaxID=421767 RepID=UPI00207C6900|nr:recombinase family protein [Peribacillus butanolivorans]MCO0597270.1 recombinase family protein [Peribacillus butanolivorans]